jgi:2-dehydropantoate 2-reductase
MRILVVGAGAVGGYLGGRLLQAGRDVTFLVRPRRAERLAEAGLLIRSPVGDLHIADPPTVLASGLGKPFDLVLLSCKAYDLEDAIESFAPAVGPDTMILPLLNGMAHLDRLDARFGGERVLGGQCVIATTLEADGTIVQLNATHAMSFGERHGGLSPRVSAVAEVMTGAGFDARSSETIVQEMWEKWVLLSTLAASTCLMRAATGDIVAAPGGAAFIGTLLDECAAVATGAGFRPGAAFMDRTRTAFTAPTSTLTASLLRDIERGARIEVDHIIGDLIRRGGALEMPLLRLAFCHLKAYEARRARSPG